MKLTLFIFVSLFFASAKIATAQTRTTADPSPTINGPLYLFNQLSAEKIEVANENVVPGVLYLNKVDKGNWYYHVYLRTPEVDRLMWWMVSLPTQVNIRRFGIEFNDEQNKINLRLSVDRTARSLTWAVEEKETTETIALAGSQFLRVYDSNRKIWAWVDVKTKEVVLDQSENIKPKLSRLNREFNGSDEPPSAGTFDELTSVPRQSSLPNPDYMVWYFGNKYGLFDGPPPPPFK